MSRFPQRDPTGDAALTSLYGEIVAAGFCAGPSPMNWFTSQSERPDIMAATFAFGRGILMAGQLPPTIKQMIVVRISTLNNCTYCRFTHRQALRALDVPDEVIDSITTGLDLSKVPPQQRAVLLFASKASQNAQDLTDKDFEELRDYGLSDGEIIEVVMTAALTDFINTWSQTSGIVIDSENGS